MWALVLHVGTGASCGHLCNHFLSLCVNSSTFTLSSIAHKHKYTHTCTHTHICIHMHTHAHTHTHTYIFMHTHMHTHTHAHTNTFTHTCTHKHIFTHIHMPIQAPRTHLPLACRPTPHLCKAWCQQPRLEHPHRYQTVPPFCLRGPIVWFKWPEVWPVLQQARPSLAGTLTILPPFIHTFTEAPYPHTAAKSRTPLAHLHLNTALVKKCKRLAFQRVHTAAKY